MISRGFYANILVGNNATRKNMGDYMDEEYITGIAPLRFHFWIEFERMRAEERIYTSSLQFENSEIRGFSPSWNEDCELLYWCNTCPRKERKTTAPAESTIKFQVRCWCDRAEVAIKSRGGCPDELPWLIAARDMECEPLTFPGATNGVWDGDEKEKTGFAKYREMYGGDE